MKPRKTGGVWDSTFWPLYFAACSVDRLGHARSTLQCMLVAIDQLNTPELVGRVADFIDDGKDVLIDSGVFTLAMEHANKHGMALDDAIGLDPDKVDGFDKLFAHYVEVVGRLGADSWGYIEIDQGGRDNKIKTRKKLERMGLRPIPVYHPLNDGWDYFDHLAERYDRICFGNIAQASAATRERLLATAWERRRRYPHLWIHALGLTPSELTTAFPINSCDSTTWISGIRWGMHRATIAHGSASNLPTGFICRLNEDRDAARGTVKAIMMCGYDATITGRQMRSIAHEQATELAVDLVTGGPYA